MAPCVGRIVLAQNALVTVLQLPSVEAELRRNHRRQSRGRLCAVRKWNSQELEELSSNHDSLVEQERTATTPCPGVLACARSAEGSGRVVARGVAFAGCHRCRRE